MCGCLGSKSNYSVTPNSKVSRKRRNKKSRKDSVCQKMYKELTELDLKVISLYKKLKDPYLRQANKQLRIWIRSLNEECPDNEEYEMLKKYIEDEYAKHIN